MNRCMKQLCVIASVMVCLLFTGCEYPVLPELKYSSSVSDTYTESEKELYGAYDVVRVSDGDTIVVKIEDEEVRVRLIGIDAPESVHPDETQNCANGEVASDYLKSLLPVGAKVYLEYDKETTDEYGRTLAYVYMDDAETMIEMVLLEAGMADTMEILPNNKYAHQFEQVKAIASEGNIGFWLDGQFTHGE